MNHLLSDMNVESQHLTKVRGLPPWKLTGIAGIAHENPHRNPGKYHQTWWIFHGDLLLGYRSVFLFFKMTSKSNWPGMTIQVSFFQPAVFQMGFKEKLPKSFQNPGPTSCLVAFSCHQISPKPKTHHQSHPLIHEESIKPYAVCQNWPPKPTLQI